MHYLCDPSPIRQTPPAATHTDRHYRNPFESLPGMVDQPRFGPILDSVRSNRTMAESSQQLYNSVGTTEQIRIRLALLIENISKLRTHIDRALNITRSFFNIRDFLVTIHDSICQHLYVSFDHIGSFITDIWTEEHTRELFLAIECFRLDGVE